MARPLKRKQNKTKKGNQPQQNTCMLTSIIKVPENNPLNDVFDYWTHIANNLYNSALYHERNCYTGLSKNSDERHPLEQQAIDDIESALTDYKLIRCHTLNNKIKKLESDTEHSHGKEIKKLKQQRQKIAALQTMFPGAKKMLTYYDLDLYFKKIDNTNYKPLPAHGAQNVLREVAQNIDNFWDAIADYYNGNTRGYTGKPRLPHYLEKGARHTIDLPACDVQVITEGGETWLKFPKTDEVLKIGQVISDDDKLLIVRIVPVSLGYEVHLTREVVIPELRSDGFMAGIDIGVNNLVTMVVNDGITPPSIYNGQGVKSINQYFNKIIAKKQSELPHHRHTSKAIRQLFSKRKTQLHNIMNWLANDIAERLSKCNVTTLVVGLNRDFKDAGKKMRNNVKQSFCYIPFRYLINAIVSSCALKGIKVIVREESYTSKASLIDGDDIPTFVPGEHKKYSFSGSRTKRGIYKTADGLILNADVNGAGNILRKELPDAFSAVSDYRYLMNPVMIQLPMKYSNASWSHQV